MLQILNLQEANDYAKNNLSAAVEKGLLKPIDKKHFAVVETEHKESGCTWLLDEIIRLSDEEMKELDLYCRYRYKEHVIKYPKGYHGAMEISAGFNL